MLRFFMSGTPRNDYAKVDGSGYQELEDSLCDCRLFSLHGSYQSAVLRWVDNVPLDRSRPYPKIIMLDSGAFTAWNNGHETSVDEVIQAYDQFLERAGDRFDEYVAINLDKIPGKKGVDPTPEEIDEAIRVSDVNFKILSERYPFPILPVYHQGESDERLFEVADMVKDTTGYICISPRNDLAEKQRVIWSRRAHMILNERYGKGVIKTHGLATTGNEMIMQVPWYSIDSAAWVLHGGYGMVDIYEDARQRYKNYFVSYDSDKHKRDDKHLANVAPDVRQAIIDRIELYGLGRTEEQLDARLSYLAQNGQDAAFTRITEELIRESAERYGVNYAMVQIDTRLRNLICMGELARYGREAWKIRQTFTRPEQHAAQDTLFGAA